MKKCINFVLIIIIKMDNKVLWSLAAKNALILSLVTILADLVSAVFTLPAGVGIVISIVKLIAVIWILYYFMKQYASEQSFVSYHESFKFGFILCFCSAFVCTVFSMLLYFVIVPETISASAENMLAAFQAQNIDSGMDYDQLMKVLPTSMVIARMLWCTICGLIFSSILANYTKKGDVFSHQDDNTEA